MFINDPAIIADIAAVFSARMNASIYEAKIGNEYIQVRIPSVIGPAITAQPKDVTAVWGDTVQFTVAAVGVNLQYQWQKMAPGSVWVDVHYAMNRTATLSVPVYYLRDGFAYRCIVTDASGKSVTSDAAVLTVMSPPFRPSEEWPVEETYAGRERIFSEEDFFPDKEEIFENEDNFPF